MHIGRVQGANRILGEPKNWDRERDGVCLSLPVRHEVVGGLSQLTSAWLPTPEEIAAIAKGAPILLTITSLTHPPVMLTVGEAPSMETA